VFQRPFVSPPPQVPQHGAVRHRVHGLTWPVQLEAPPPVELSAEPAAEAPPEQT
jgi:hypothetical protein